jgi:hypothetical protein
MINIFIAVGGSGTKVAEALVRLLTVGFPTKINEAGIPTSAGDELQIWRLDPDRGSGAAQSLQQSVDEYNTLQNSLKRGGANSLWSLEIDKGIRHLDPLTFSEHKQKENERMTLRGILNSQGKSHNGGVSLPSTPFLNLFYDQKDLDVEIDRGFYQKPFIGAPVVSIFAESLKDPNSPGGKQCKFTHLENQSVRFFLCGSLHGGTGACGVPVMGKFLGDYKNKKTNLNWQIGGCLLTPYNQPPAPPFEQLSYIDSNTFRQTSDGYLQNFSNVEPFRSMGNEEDKRKLVEQILLGFYADPKDMTTRARHSLVYYKDHITSYFNALYLIGKQNPDELIFWSNGGASQQNPINTAEIVAALAALDFYSGNHDAENVAQSYVIGSSTRKEQDQGIRLNDLPQYVVGDYFHIDAEKVLLSTAVLRHLLIHQVPWKTAAAVWPKDLKRLKEYYGVHPEHEDEDRNMYRQAASILRHSIQALLSPSDTLGWDGQDHNQMYSLLLDDARVVADLTEKFNHRMMSTEAKGEIPLGRSTLKISTKEFGEYAPKGNEFTRGEYLRCIWNELLKRASGEAQFRHGGLRHATT